MIQRGPQFIESIPRPLAVPLPRGEPASTRQRRELRERQAVAATVELGQLRPLLAARVRLVAELDLDSRRVSALVRAGHIYGGGPGLDQRDSRAALKAFDRLNPGLGQRIRDLERVIVAARLVAPKVRTKPRAPKRNPTPVRFAKSEPAQPVWTGRIAR